MPIYDYACRDCGHQVEVLHSVHAPGPAACEACGGPMHKLLSPPSIHFKGSGWAKKDRSDAGRTKAAAKSDTSADKAATSEAKPDAGAKTTTEGAAKGAGGSTAMGAAGPASAD